MTDEATSGTDEATSGGGPGNPGRRRVRSEPTPVQRAIGLLTRREHSRKELARKLTARGVSGEDAQAAVERLSDAGWQDDRRFAESIVRARASGGYGPIRIRAELGMHGLDREAVATALETFEGDWAELAREQVARRYGAAAKDDPVVRRKAADFLVRRGFDGDCIRAATRFDPDD